MYLWYFKLNSFNLVYHKYIAQVPINNALTKCVYSFTYQYRQVRSRNENFACWDIFRLTHTSIACPTISAKDNQTVHRYACQEEGNTYSHSHWALVE